MSGILRAAAAALALTLLAPTAAHADRWTGSDEAGDVEGWHYDPEPKPCGTATQVDATADTNTDIIGVTVRHTRRAMVVTTRFRELDPELEQAVWVYVRSNGGGWWLHLERFQPRGGWWRVFTFIAEEPRLPDPDDIDDECGGVLIGLVGHPCRISRDIDFGSDRIRMAVPRNCIGNPRWVRVGTSAHRFVDSENPGDESSTVFSDEWDGGVELSPWMAPFGPRVRAARGAAVDNSATRDPADPDWPHYYFRHGRKLMRR